MSHSTIPFEPQSNESYVLLFISCVLFWSPFEYFHFPMLILAHPVDFFFLSFLSQPAPITYKRFIEKRTKIQTKFPRQRRRLVSIVIAPRCCRFTPTALLMNPQTATCQPGLEFLKNTPPSSEHSRFSLFFISVGIIPRQTFISPIAEL